MKIPIVRELRVPLAPVTAVTMLAKAVRLNNEDSLKTWFELLAAVDTFGGSLALDPTCDRIAHDIQMPLGRVDTICVHADHTMTVVAIRNGSLGYQHVLQGLGVVRLQVVQVRVSKVAPAGVKAALVFTTTGTIHMDALIMQACMDAGVSPFILPLFSACIDSLRLELKALCDALPVTIESRAGVAA